MRALVSGSMAFDYIMHFPGRFADYLDAAGGKVGATFTTPTMRRAWGGCAGNIAYGLAKLGDAPLLLATVGGDFAPYRARLREFGIPDDGVREYAESFTAQAYIVTDDDNNQITLFHPGAMNNAHEQDAAATAKAKNADIAIVSPNGREGMLAHAEQLSTLGIPLVVDPGQAVGLFTGDELRKLLGFATCAIFNRHEFATAAKAAGFKRGRSVGNGKRINRHRRRTRRPRVDQQRRKKRRNEKRRNGMQSSGVGRGRLGRNPRPDGLRRRFPRGDVARTCARLELARHLGLLGPGRRSQSPIRRRPRIQLVPRPSPLRIHQSASAASCHLLKGVVPFRRKPESILDSNRGNGFRFLPERVRF